MMKVNLFCVGTIKSATTSIYNYLKKHPKIFFPEIKELHFFSDVIPADDNKEGFNKNKNKHSTIVNNLAEYHSFYFFKSNYIYYGDCSPSYLSDPNAPQRIYNYNPKSQILISLRNPIDRAESHYYMNIRRGVEKDNFRNSIYKDYLKTNKRLFIDHKYIELGFYGEQIERYLKYFPKEQIHIVKYEDLKKDTPQEINDFLSKIGLEKLENDVFNKVYNTYAKPRFGFVSKYKDKKIVRKLLPEKYKDQLKKIFFELKKKEDTLNSDDIKYLENIFKEDQDKLDKLIGFKYF